MTHDTWYMTLSILFMWNLKYLSTNALAIISLVKFHPFRRSQAVVLNATIGYKQGHKV